MPEVFPVIVICGAVAVMKERGVLVVHMGAT